MYTATSPPPRPPPTSPRCSSRRKKKTKEKEERQPTVGTPPFLRCSRTQFSHRLSHRPTPHRLISCFNVIKSFCSSRSGNSRLRSPGQFLDCLIFVLKWPRHHKKKITGKICLQRRSWGADYLKPGKRPPAGCNTEKSSAHLLRQRVPQYQCPVLEKTQPNPQDLPLHPPRMKRID